MRGSCLTNYERLQYHFITNDTDYNRRKSQKVITIRNQMFGKVGHSPAGQVEKSDLPQSIK